MNRNVLSWAIVALSVSASALLSLVTASSAVRAEGRRLSVDDFEDGDRRAASGLSWMAIADDLRGGASFADLDVAEIKAAAAGPGHALRVSGEVTADGFAGAWVALDGGARATDISDFAGIRLRVRGPGGLKVLLRGGPMAGSNYAAPIEARADWTTVEVPFHDLTAQRPGSPALDPKTVRWLGVGVGASRSGHYEFAVDDVELYATRDDARLRVQPGPAMAVLFTAGAAADGPAGPWKELAADPPADGKEKRLPDATALLAHADEAQDLVWFRIPLSGPLPARWFGVNLALDVDGDPTNGMEWWGANKSFRFDRLVTAYGSVADGGYEGTLGIADAALVQQGRMMGAEGDGLRVLLDRAHPAIVVGVPASSLAPSGHGPVRVVAAVGSAFQHNDDVPDEGAAVFAR